MSAAKFVVPLVVFLSLLMVSNVPFDKFPLLTVKGGKSNSLKITFFLIFIASVGLFGGLAFFPWTFGYVLFKVFAWLIGIGRSTEEDIAEQTTYHN